MTNTETNSQLETNVRDQLAGDASIDASRIKIHANGGYVELSGVVDSVHQKFRAGEDTQRLTGVKSVSNHLVVNNSHQQVSDAELTATAEAGLDANGLVPKDKVSISVSDGWVTLTGNVRHYYERQAAAHVIRHLSGIQGFTNKVTVSKDPSANVSQSISDAIGRMATVEAQSVKVADADGVVTLTGTVHNVAEKEEAERAASAAPGVVSVNNEIVVAG